MQVHNAPGDGIVSHLRRNIEGLDGEWPQPEAARPVHVGPFDTICERASPPSVAHLIAVVHQDEEEVEAAHDGSRQVDILLQTLAAIVAAAHRVGGGQDGGAGVKCCLHRAKKGVRHTQRKQTRSVLPACEF